MEHDLLNEKHGRIAYRCRGPALHIELPGWSPLRLPDTMRSKISTSLGERG